MLIIPAIDIIDGQCVRLSEGRYDRAQIYSARPEEVAREFSAAGAACIHIVDLDAAHGAGRNRQVLARIRRAVDCRLEIGGGIRGEQDIEEIIDLGIERLVLGTVLARKPEQAARWVEKYGPLFVGGIDAREGMVRVSGWEESSGIQDLALAGQGAILGLSGIIYTNIARDGTLAGPDIERTNRIAAVSGLPVILSGGIGSEEDVARVAREKHENVRGLIVGKAIYEKTVVLPDMIAAYQRPEDAEVLG
jgi:phosphoribosylformimino-5-aminoimidazole carboxamide ribotide isomerase